MFRIDAQDGEQVSAFHTDKIGDVVARFISVLGVRLTDVSRSVALQLMEHWMCAGDGLCRSVYFANAHTLNVSVDEPEFREILNAADAVFNDGTGVRWAARQRGVELRDNLCGTDVIPALFEATNHKGYRYFLLGGAEETIRGAAHAARERFPGWELAGYHHGYVHDAGGDRVIDTINSGRVDLLLVGMGNPLQERWIHRHREQLKVPLAVGVGGLFDHWIDRPPRAPMWVRKAGCEWVHKLLLQPHKWRRYLLGNPKFLYRMTCALHDDHGAVNAWHATSVARDRKPHHQNLSNIDPSVEV